jgi:CBS domain containing-hemolysin-like protein
MNIFAGIAVVVICLILEAFFAGSEIGFISCNRIRMSNLADKKDKRAGIIISFLDHPEHFLGTTLVGVNLSVIIGSSVATAIIARYVTSPGRDALVTTLIVFPLVLIFGEMVPKILYQQYADRLSLFSAYPLKVITFILFPFVFAATKISGFVSRLFVRGRLKKNPYVTREEIRLLMLDAAKRGILDKSEIDMTSEIFDFGRTSVHSVMVPLERVISASEASSTKDVLELVSNSGYSRIPIFSGREDNIIGVVEMSDLVSESVAEKELKELILPPYKVDEDTHLASVLEDFRHNEENMAVVMNKTGRAIGIATIEDIVEEIFGEIEDEYDVTR